MKTLSNLITIIVILSTSIAHAQDRRSWENKKETLYIGKSGPSQDNEIGVMTIHSKSTKRDEHIIIRAYTFGQPITSITNANKHVWLMAIKNKKSYKSNDQSGIIKIKIIQNTYPPTYRISISATLQSSETGEEIKIRKIITTTPSITCQEDPKSSETNAENTIPKFCLRIAGLTQQPNTTTAPHQAESTDETFDTP